jgi:hypothetical protein
MVSGFSNPNTHHAPKRIGERDNLFGNFVARIIPDGAAAMPRVRTAILGREVRFQFKFGALADLISAKLADVGCRAVFQRARKDRHFIQPRRACAGLKDQRRLSLSAVLLAAKRGSNGGLAKDESTEQQRMDVAVPANMKVGLAQDEIARRGWALSAGEALALLGSPTSR